MAEKPLKHLALSALQPMHRNVSLLGATKETNAKRPNVVNQNNKKPTFSALCNVKTLAILWKLAALNAQIKHTGVGKALACPCG
ncbi:MAG: hypothetical protein WCD07_06520 [Burkholderiales bacterium]